MAGITLKAARVNKGFTQAEAGKLFGVSKETIVNWERGKTFPTVDKIPDIEREYGVAYDEIIFLPKNYR